MNLSYGLFHPCRILGKFGFDQQTVIRRGDHSPILLAQQIDERQSGRLHICHSWLHAFGGVEQQGNIKRSFRRSEVPDGLLHSILIQMKFFGKKADEILSGGIEHAGQGGYQRHFGTYAQRFGKLTHGLFGCGSNGRGHCRRIHRQRFLLGGGVRLAPAGGLPVIGLFRSLFSLFPELMKPSDEIFRGRFRLNPLVAIIRVATCLPKQGGIERRELRPILRISLDREHQGVPFDDHVSVRSSVSLQKQYFARRPVWMANHIFKIRDIAAFHKEDQIGLFPGMHDREPFPAEKFRFDTTLEIRIRRCQKLVGRGRPVQNRGRQGERDRVQSVHPGIHTFQVHLRNIPNRRKGHQLLQRTVPFDIRLAPIFLSQTGEIAGLGRDPAAYRHDHHGRIGFASERVALYSLKLPCRQTDRQDFQQ